MPSFAEVVTDHWVPVFRFLMHLSGDMHDAEELTQETFLRAMPHWKEQSNPRAWLFRIARNAFLDQTRRRAVVKFESLGADRPADRASPAIETTEQAEKVKAALAQLTELARTVFLMRVEGELSFAEIAAALESTEEACRWHMHEARRKLAEMLTRPEA